jgi:hypothetical protein
MKYAVVMASCGIIYDVFIISGTGAAICPAVVVARCNGRL